MSAWVIIRRTQGEHNEPAFGTATKKALWQGDVETGFLAVIQASKPRARIMRYELTDHEWSAIKPIVACARNGLMQCNKNHSYSMTSSARASSVSGTVRPSAFAVVRLMTRSNLVGCSTGRSAGLAPRRTLAA